MFNLNSKRMIKSTKKKSVKVGGLTSEEREELRNLQSQNPSKYADLKNDIAFKNVFTHPEILIGLLNSIIDEYEITEVNFLKREELEDGVTYVAQELYDPLTDKRSTLDLACKTKEGATIIIEMQKNEQANFSSRALFYASLELMTQVKIGEGYKLHPVYSINFLNFEINSEPDYINYYAFMNVATHRLIEDNILNFIFVELPKFTCGETECTTRLKKIVYSLKHIEGMEDVPESLKSDKYFEKFYNFAEVMNFPEKQRYLYFKSMETERDRINIIRTAENKARKEATAQTKLEIAKEMLSDGVPIATIVKYTSLTEAEVAVLQQN